MHLPSFQKLLIYIIQIEEMKNFVRKGALLKNISILPIIPSAVKDQNRLILGLQFMENKNINAYKINKFQ